MGGIVGALVAAAALWVPAANATANLPGATRLGVHAALVGIAVLAGFLAGSAIGRRAGHNPRHLGIFSGLTSAVAGGMIGFVGAVALTAGYLQTYSSWPQDTGGRVLVGLAYVAFGGVGCCCGAMVGGVIGLCTGGLLKLLRYGR